MNDLDQQKIQTQSAQSKKILIMAGGTGGHIFPAIAVAQRLQSEGWSVVWLGGVGGMETRLVPQHGFQLETIQMRGLRGKGLKSVLTAPWMVLKAVLQAHRVIKNHRPNMVIGFGGYTGFAGGIAAKLTRKPLVIHEQNAVAGLTNRVLSAFATRTLCAFPSAFGATAGEGDWVGNPVRADISALADPQVRFADRTGALKVLVVGGSLGAQVFNETLPLALALMPIEHRPAVTHQSGEKHQAALIKNYQTAGINEVACVPFIGDMAQAYAQADVVLCRAGALTVAELAAAGAAGILIPYPAAVDDHQTANARYLSDNQAAILLPQAQASPEKLAEILQNLTRADCLEMAKQARKLALTQATEKVVAVCLSLVSGKS